MDKKDILETLDCFLHGREVQPEQSLKIFAAALELITLKKENTELKEAYKEAIVGMEQISKQINELEEAHNEYLKYVNFMGDMQVETAFGDSKVKDIAQMLYKGKEVGAQPQLEEDNHNDGCCGGGCGCKG